MVYSKNSEFRAELYNQVTKAKSLLQSIEVFFKNLPDDNNHLNKRVVVISSQLRSTFDLLVQSYNIVDIELLDEEKKELKNILYDIAQFNTELKDILNSFSTVFEALNTNGSFTTKQKSIKDCFDIKDLLDEYVPFFSHKLVKVQEFQINLILSEAEKKVQNLDAAKRAFEGEHTRTVYTEAFEKYSDLAKRYERAFYALIYLSIMSTFIACVVVYFRNNLLYEVLIIKAVIAVAIITLLTLWIRRASHYRKLAEQAEQTALELRAIPSFLKEVREEDQRLIYKDLAGKYFGKTLDQTQHDKIGDLMQDQIKNTIELTKATVDAAKGYKDIVSAKDEAKDNNSSNNKEDKS